MKEWLLSGMPPGWVSVVGLIAYAHLEWWLPRTKKVRADSGLELLGNVLKKMLVHKIPLIGKLLTAMASKEPPAEQPAEGPPQ